MPKLLSFIGPTERWLIIVIACICAGLALTTDTFFTLVNAFDLLNYSAVNVIFAAGLLVVLVAGGIDISFAVGASVVQYLAVTLLMQIGGGNWALGFILSAFLGFCLGAINATLIYRFRLISIVVTIATFNLFFGLLMFFSGGVSIYLLPDWMTRRVILFEHETAAGWAEITLPVLVMAVVVLATWFLLRKLSYGRQLFAMGDNVEGARRLGINIGAMHYLAYGWLGACAGIAGLMQAHHAQEVVPNALYGRELEVLAAVVLGAPGWAAGAVLCWGRSLASRLSPSPRTD
ncbi:ABC transporter permease [Paracoccus methylarcula]|uniref:ABC transporter permease n=1 Tax=Paracoccus methylarcula TaxID=72022 RepID=UPI001FEBA90C|nr:ABC transporter permease [Paracoccus methylarcula]